MRWNGSCHFLSDDKKAKAVVFYALFKINFKNHCKKMATQNSSKNAKLKFSYGTFETT